MTYYQYTDIEVDQNLVLKNENKVFYSYLLKSGISSRGLSKALVLPEKHSFYYDDSEIKAYSIVVNLKKLNDIKQLENFLYSLYHSSKANTYFCGCFIQNKRPDKISGNHKIRKYVRALTLLIDSLTVRLLSEHDVKSLLDAHQFNVINMKEIQGVTYFYSKKR